MINLLKLFTLSSLVMSIHFKMTKMFGPIEVQLKFTYHGMSIGHNEPKRNAMRHVLLRK